MKRHRVRLTMSKESARRTIEFDIDEEEYLLYGALDAGVEIPHACEQGWCLACAAKLVAGELDMGDAYLYYPQDREAGFVLLCSAKARSDLWLEHDFHRTRREMLQHRLNYNLLTRAYPQMNFRRGRSKR
ncbi:MAG: 2Fe-2S iron-sulfur cluster binding domain-containing protein [Hydrogenibacillus sp.]|nr:2Fe-2S iron-sulfur cluster binding domain-containing protein [Hydrogenibacillus sp.]